MIGRPSGRFCSSDVTAYEVRLPEDRSNRCAVHLSVSLRCLARAMMTRGGVFMP